MKLVRQDYDTLSASLTEMEAAWMDDTALRIIDRMSQIPAKPLYTRSDLEELFAEADTRKEFDVVLTTIRLFLDLSDDQFAPALTHAVGEGGIGIKRFKKDKAGFLDGLERLGVAEKMTEIINTPVVWADVLKERLKGGRGKAIKGQKRGRSLEDFVEERVKSVFGSTYDTRCNFIGRDGNTEAKADFAMPSKTDPRIVIESKGYGATGSKQTDVLGDLREIVRVKRPDTTLLFVTDGLTWRRRASDLRKIIAMQNTGEITRIYTRSMTDEMIADFQTLKAEHAL